MSKANGIKSRMDTLESISKLDKRRTFTDFYLTFDLDDYELFGKIRAMLNGEVEPNNPAFMKFLDRCLEVYKVNTHDYSGITEDMMMDEVGKFKYRNGFIPKAELLGRAITFTPSLLPRSTKLKSEYTNDVYDALKHDLVIKVRDEHSMVRNIAAYQELQRRIMRF
ncbi:hypothetical protein [Limosilactobacillus equigenerosi]|uniref:Uncharacterized protein n=1 Tax=Limosilactobacillus equigenerosi DSM 18793 = JCM 14505 TaxID=1423742 RepID=A0A0R1V0M2_9LACO|nr:hypothetical protein [Limosilactobacillus equigenerosi]KRL96389.1 hypothetical protein FC21_GL000188 [Limosilactobacillus equigenerosi DSM 18793 = JCM 14505]